MHDGCRFSQQHVPSDNKPSLKLGGTCPKLLPPHVPPGHHGGAQEAHGLPSGPLTGSLGAAPTVGTPPQASPAPPASVSPPTTPTELTVSSPAATTHNLLLLLLPGDLAWCALTTLPQTFLSCLTPVHSWAMKTINTPSTT